MPATRTRRIEALEARRNALAEALRAQDDQVIERGTEMTDEEAAAYNEQHDELAQVNVDLSRVMDREEAIARSMERSQALAAGGQGRPTPGTTAGNAAHDDRLVYRAWAGTSVGSDDHDPLMDVWRAQTQNDPEAQQRIREYNEARVAAGTISIMRASDRSDFGGLIVPEYAIAEFAELARELRPFLNSLPSRPLTRSPVIIPLQTVGTAMATPSGENVAYTTADPATTPLTLTARTIAGVAEVSVEAVEFGTLESPILFGDMLNAYAERLDYQAFHGDGNNNTHLGVFATPNIGTADGSGTTSFRDHYEQCLYAAALIRSVDKRTASHVVMSSMRWYSLQAATDDQGRPLMADTYTYPQNTGGSVPGRIFAGLQVVVDDNIVASGGDDDAMIVYRAAEYVLREQNGGNPATLRVDQAKAAQGTVQFIARGFSIFSAARRPNSTTIVEDLPEPSFPGIVTS